MQRYYFYYENVFVGKNTNCYGTDLVRFNIQLWTREAVYVCQSRGQQEKEKGEYKKVGGKKLKRERKGLVMQKWKWA